MIGAAPARASAAKACPSASSRGLELAEIFRQHAAAFLSKRSLPLRHRKVMQQIINCRTPVLGGHRQRCAQCGFERYLYHSCRNRHCPKCQTAAKEAWRAARQLELLPVPYFHNVFTLPHELNGLVLKSENNQRLLLKLLFDAAAQTLLAFGKRELKGTVGFTLVLHTWDQQLRPHFHLHGLIASGAIADDGSQWVAGGNQFLFPVRGLSQMFRGKFLSRLQAMFDDQSLDLPDDLIGPTGKRQWIKRLYKKSWVVYSKAPFAGPAKLLDYLSRYTHRVALTHSRLVDCQDGQVTFTFRDRRDGDRRKQMSLPVEQFMGRFLTHVLPSRLMRIRHYGFLANRAKKNQLRKIRRLIGAKSPQPIVNPSAMEWLKELLGIDTNLCPCCGEQLLEQSLACQLPPAGRWSSQAKTDTRHATINPRGPP
jgi:predicted Zn-ribbon and HTH transcriptional regulator